MGAGGMAGAFRRAPRLRGTHSALGITAPDSEPWLGRPVWQPPGARRGWGGLLPSPPSSTPGGKRLQKQKAGIRLRHEAAPHPTQGPSWHLRVKNVESEPRGFPVALVVKNPPANTDNTGDAGLIPGSGRSPGGGRGNPLQCSSLGSPKERGAGRTTVHGVTEGRTRLTHVACMHTLGPWAAAPQAGALSRAPKGLKEAFPGAPGP